MNCIEQLRLRTPTYTPKPIFFRHVVLFLMPCAACLHRAVQAGWWGEGDTLDAACACWCLDGVAVWTVLSVQCGQCTPPRPGEALSRWDSCLSLITIPDVRFPFFELWI